MSTTKMNKSNTTTKTTNIKAHPQLTYDMNSRLIRNVIPKIKLAYPGVRYIRLEGGEWIFTSTADNKQVTQMIRQAEADIIKAELSVARAVLPEHPMGEALTALTISRLKELELPAGGKPPRFNNGERRWEFAASDQEAMQLLLTRFKALTQKCILILDPPCRWTLMEHEMGSRFTAFVIKNLRRVPLPKDAKRISFDNETLLWRFACQNEDDLDFLVRDFKELEATLIEEYKNPRSEAAEGPAKEKATPAPEFTGMDFPILGTDAPATV